MDSRGRSLLQFSSGTGADGYRGYLIDQTIFIIWDTSLSDIVLTSTDPDDPAVHPNGQDIVFNSEGFTPGYPEYWVMENFLPKTKNKK